MAALYRTQGIVLAKEDRLEADRIFTVFTRDFGKVRLRAVSERKITSKLRGGLELFCFSEIEFVQGRAYRTITDCVALEGQWHMRKSIARMRAMQRFADMADMLLGGQEAEERIWNLLRGATVFLNKETIDKQEWKVFAHHFFWNMIACAGYAPSIEAITREDAFAARFIQDLLVAEDSSSLASRMEGLNEEFLKTVAREHLSKVIES